MNVNNYINVKQFIIAILLGGSFLFGLYYTLKKFNVTTEEMKLNSEDFKDGIQNHLVWSIKGNCYFVKPYTNQSVLLVPVSDCDKK